MTNLVVSLPDERAEQLRVIAKQMGISEADLILVSLDEFLAKRDDQFENAAFAVLAKNEELYKRLA